MASNRTVRYYAISGDDIRATREDGTLIIRVSQDAKQLTQQQAAAYRAHETMRRQRNRNRRRGN